MVDMNEWDRNVIEEFHHRGAKTGTERVNPLVYQPVGDDLAIFASKAGAPTNPDWYHNLLANPEATVELEDGTVRVKARVASDEEREPIWEKQKRDMSNFAEYEGKTSRKIPVVILERVD
jgi:deazaflavin-dependent oxidoreductase (nitroreductase family)